MIKVLVNGANGRMGQEVIKVLDSYDDMILIGGFDKEDSHLSTFKMYTDINQIDETPDVIIDFSIPAATLNILEYAKSENIPIVIATTGFSDDDMNKVKDYSKYIPIFKSANMSFDINLMAKLVADIAKKLSNNDVEIIETHHKNKIDSPSGTALLLADSINNARNNSMEYVFDRHSKKEKRKGNEIGFSSIRGGNIVGEHAVQFFSEYETFEIKHTSYSRSVFADGAIKAARFIISQSNGMYDMNNMM